MELILDIINSEINSFNAKASDFEVTVLDINEVTENPDYRCDYRLYDKNCYTSVLPLVFYNKAVKKAVAATNIIMYDKKDFSKIEFGGYYIQENKIQRIPLDKLNNDIGKYGVTIGYTEFAIENHNKVKLTKFFINIARRMINIPEIFFFIECTGTEDLGKQVMENRTFFEDGSFSKNKIGTTLKSGFSVEKFAKHLNLKEGKNIYNLYTLGKVYSNKQLAYVAVI